MTKWPYDPALQSFGAVYKPAVVAPGQSYWKLIVAQGPMDIGGNHHIYVDAWDESGNRVVGLPIIFYSSYEEWPALTEAKHGEPQAANLPMFAGGNAYGVRVGDGLPSDALFGMGLASFGPHQSFRLIFQRTMADGMTVPVDPDPNEPSTAFEAIELAQHYLNVAKELI